MKLDYQIYNDKYFTILLILEKRNDFLKKYGKYVWSDVRYIDFIDLFQLYCPYINNKIKSEIIEFDKNHENSLVELIEFYNSKIKKEAFEQFDIKFIYLIYYFILT
jgi:hypothetical protein